MESFLELLKKQLESQESWQGRHCEGKESRHEEQECYHMEQMEALVAALGRPKDWSVFNSCIDNTEFLSVWFNIRAMSRSLVEI